MDDEERCKCKICKRWFTPWKEGNLLEREICVNCYEEGIDRAEERRRGYDPYDGPFQSLRSMEEILYSDQDQNCNKGRKSWLL